jgi:methylated-DNA-[protein]-cysteine S-methyltransferase
MNYHSILPSPLGDILLTADDHGLTGINFQNARGAKQPPRGSVESPEPFRRAAQQLDAYFRGELRDFDLPLSPAGTAFQRRVWDALRQIPYGMTISYGDLARRVGKPTASRAVGAANGRNPLPIVVPCHRVVGADGRLTGYHGGTHLKAFLLKLEEANA